jgi:hypothetical protein
MSVQDDTRYEARLGEGGFYIALITGPRVVLQSEHDYPGHPMADLPPSLAPDRWGYCYSSRHKARMAAEWLTSDANYYGGRWPTRVNSPAMQD